MKDNEVLLISIKQSIEDNENMYQDALKKMDTVRGVIENVKYLPLMKKYEYSEYVPGREDLPGNFMKKEMPVFPVRELRGQGQYNINIIYK